MLPFPHEPPANPRSQAQPPAPRHLLASIRKLNALYEELNQLVENARGAGAQPPR
jgi:hypothetical protein